MGPAVKARRRTKQVHKCPYEGCTASFARPVRLRSHVMLHEGTQPYRCSWSGCDKAFAEKSNMTIHMRIHSKVHPFACPEPGCGKSFASKGNMQDHERRHRGDRYVDPKASMSRPWIYQV